MIRTLFITGMALMVSLALVVSVYAQTNTPMPTTTTPADVPSGAPSTGFGR